MNVRECKNPKLPHSEGQESRQDTLGLKKVKSKSVISLRLESFLPNEL